MPYISTVDSDRAAFVYPHSPDWTTNQAAHAAANNAAIGTAHRAAFQNALMSAYWAALETSIDATLETAVWTAIHTAIHTAIRQSHRAALDRTIGPADRETYNEYTYYDDAGHSPSSLAIRHAKESVGWH